MAWPYSYRVTGTGPFDDNNYEVLNGDGSVIAVCETRGIAEATVLALLLCDRDKYSKMRDAIDEGCWYDWGARGAPVEVKGYAPGPGGDGDDEGAE